MRLPGRMVWMMSLGLLGACSTNEEVLRPDPSSPPASGDVGPAEPAGNASEANTRPPADAACPLDVWEPNDSREQFRADQGLMHIYKHGPRTLTQLTACLGNDDWFPAYSDRGLSDPSGAVVRWDAAVGPLEVDVVDAQGAALSFGNPGDINERRPGEVRLLSASHGGRFFIRVRASGTVSVPYSLDVYAPVVTN